MSNGERKIDLLDRSKVMMIPLGDEVRVRAGVENDSWAWTYLMACLASAVGLDEARAVICMVQLEEIAGLYLRTLDVLGASS
jgi:hypothetical protein